MNNLTKLRNPLFAVIFTLVLWNGAVSAQEQSAAAVSVSSNTAEAEEALQEEQQAKERKMLEQIHARRNEILQMKANHQKAIDELTEKQRARRAAKCAAEKKTTEECAPAQISIHVRTDRALGTGISAKERIAEVKKFHIGFDRKMQINPIKQTDGIKTGWVVAYGHLIRPPYKFEYKATKLYVNGVQVEPSLTWERDYKKNRHESTALELQNADILTNLEHKTKAIYLKKHGKVPEEELRTEILEMFKTHPLIKDAKWQEMGTALLYTQKDAPYDFMNGVLFGMPPRLVEKRPSLEEFHRSTLDLYERDLKEGACLFWGTEREGIDGQSCRDMKANVNKIVNESGLSKDEKAEKLCDAFSNWVRETPFDILENYNAEEWK